jgi:hypothetical protein
VVAEREAYDDESDDSDDSDDSDSDDSDSSENETPHKRMIKDHSALSNVNAISNYENQIDSGADFGTRRSTFTKRNSYESYSSSDDDDEDSGSYETDIGDVESDEDDDDDDEEDDSDSSENETPLERMMKDATPYERMMEDEYDEESLTATPITAEGQRPVQNNERAALAARKNFRGSRLRRSLIVLASLLCIGAVVFVVLYVVDPGGDDDPTNVSSNRDLPTIGPAAPSPAPATPTISPAFPSPAPVTQSPSVALSVYPTISFNEITVTTTYSAIVPFGKENGVTPESMAPDLIASMDLLAPQVLLDVTTSSNQVKRRILAVIIVQLPTSIGNLVEAGTCLAAQ